MTSPLAPSVDRLLAEMAGIPGAPTDASCSLAGFSLSATRALSHAPLSVRHAGAGPGLPVIAYRPNHLEGMDRYRPPEGIYEPLTLVPRAACN